MKEEISDDLKNKEVEEDFDLTAFLKNRKRLVCVSCNQELFWCNPCQAFHHRKTKDKEHKQGLKMHVSYNKVSCERWQKEAKEETSNF